MQPPGAQPYAEQLGALSSALPNLSARLQAAERMRAQRLARLVDGARLAGIDELLGHLQGVVAAWSAEPALASVAPLVARTLADVETAVEAALSGFPAVAADAMRDVMEVEFLLLDFVLAPERLEEWLHADRKTRMRRFGPAAVRDRVCTSELAELVGGEARNVDYRAHSEALHPTPWQALLPFQRRGHVPGDDLWSLDAPFMEVLQHAHRLGDAVVLLVERLAPGTAAQSATAGPLPRFADAHVRTQQLLDVFLRALDAAFTTADLQEDDSPRDQSMT